MAVDPNPDTSDLDLIQHLHSPLEAKVSLQELQQASEQDPVLSRHRTFIHSGWPPASGLPDSLGLSASLRMNFFARTTTALQGAIPQSYPLPYRHMSCPLLMKATLALSSSTAGKWSGGKA